jgi:endonuclease G
LPSVGRIDVPELLLTPYAGTGFFVGEGLLMTNRHVAVMFSDGVGAGPAFLRFKPNHTPRLSSRYEVGDLDQHSQEQPFEVVETLLIHPHWDIAVLRVAPLGNAALPPALRLADAPPPLFGGGAITHIAVVGYPMLDDRSNVPEQMRIFRQIFGRKRLMPGYLTGYADQISKWGTVQHAVTHDATTLGGNSGSAVIDLTTGLVLAIHFGGRYRVANFGVPAWELAQDPRIVALGVQFGSLDPPLADAQTIRVTSTPVPPLWLGAWEGLRPLGE